MENIVFEFNDMRTVYSEGICVLLAKMVSNPSVAYRLAEAIANQGKWQEPLPSGVLLCNVM